MPINCFEKKYSIRPQYKSTTVEGIKGVVIVIFSLYTPTLMLKKWMCSYNMLFDRGINGQITFFFLRFNASLLCVYGEFGLILRGGINSEY